MSTHDLRELISGAAVWTADTETLLAAYKFAHTQIPPPAKASDVARRLAAEAGESAEGLVALQLGYAISAVQCELKRRAAAGDPLLLRAEDFQRLRARGDVFVGLAADLRAGHPFRERLDPGATVVLPSLCGPDGLGPFCVYDVRELTVEAPTA